MMAVDMDVAWALVDTTANWFTEADRAVVYAALGAGDSYSAIAHTLEIAVQMRQGLPAKLIRDLTVWLDGYAGHPHEPELRDLLSTYKPSSCRCAGALDALSGRVTWAVK